MKKYHLVIAVAFCFLIVFACKDKDGSSVEVEETMTSGSTTFLVDNTVQPIVEDVIAVFTSMYDRSAIKQVNKTENEVLRDLLSGSARVAVMSRKLTPDEEAYFKNRKIEPQVTEFATDAIAFIAHTQAADTVIQLEEVVKLLKGEASKVKKLVFDNPNSSTVQYLLKQAAVSKLPSSGIHFVKTNEELVQYININKDAVGVIGINWLLQSPPSLTKFVENIQVLGVNNVKYDKSGAIYYKPTQSNIGLGSYPLTRKLFVLNYQGKQGLGMGFANYISAPDGQRIILKSGLLPVDIPKRELEVRNKL